MTTDTTQLAEGTGTPPPGQQDDGGTGTPPPGHKDDGGTGNGAAIPQETVDFARQQGWVPKEDYKGPPDKWVDADVFADRAHQINPIINQRNRALAEEIKQLRAENASLKNDTTEAVRFVRASAKREYEEKLTALQRERADAISEGDGAKVVEVEARIGQLERPTVKKEDPAVPQIPMPVQEAGNAFVGRNPWFGDGPEGDPRKTRLAMAVAAEIRGEDANAVKSADYFERIERKLYAEYPEIFRRKAAPQPMSDAGGAPGGNSASKVKKGFGDMPKEAQEVAVRLEAQGHLKRDAYAIEYWAEQAAGRV